MRSSRFLSILLVVAAGFVQPITTAAQATANPPGESIQVLGVTQQDLDGDGTPEVTVIECAFATEHDRVLVYDQMGDMPVGAQWQSVTDFLDDIWIFDVGADGTAQLIVDFHVEDERYTALVYDDIDGDGQVSYQVTDNQITAEGSSFWHVKVTTNRPWNQQGGLWNADVILLIDGYDGLQLFLGADTHGLSSAPDGVVDWQIEIGDKDGDGIVDYLLQRVINSALANYRSARLRGTHIRVQMADRVPEPYGDAVFWPLLIGRDSATGAYFDHTPAIAVDWVAGDVYWIGVLGYPIESGYHILSYLPVEKQSLSILNFEVPMAYYDMANDQDGWPELHLRFDLAVPYDPYFLHPWEGEVETPNVEVNYSWDQDNDNRWDYKMNLGANYAIEEVVEFPDFAIKSVPYDEVIPWVRDHTWDVAMLVFDGQPTGNSEGMFARGWMIQRGYVDGERVEPSGVKRAYLMGFSSRPPSGYYQDIEEGMRGEYSFQYCDTPRMYLGAIDRQLHLRGAESGVWNLGEGHYLRYTNLDGDAYLDQWQEERDGNVIQQLNYGQGVFVYCGEGRVQMKQVDTGPALFEAQPPGSYDEWQRLDEKLRASKVDFAPEDFRGMLGQLAGPETQILGATVRDYRITDQGFRFILELQPGFAITSDPEGWASGLAAPGAYAVSFDGTAWEIRPATPAQPRAGELIVTPPLLAMEWSTFEVLLENEGLEDLYDLPVFAVLADPAGQQVLTATVALLPAEGSQQASWDWAPPHAGTWQARVEVAREPGPGDDLPRQVLLTTALQVESRRVPSPEWLLSLGGRIPPAIVALLAGMALLAASAGAIWAVGRGSASPR